MTDTKDVAYIRKRLCNASDLMSEVFVRAEDMSKENIKLKKLLKRTRKYLSEQETPYSLIKRIDEILGETTNED